MNLSRSWLLNMMAWMILNHILFQKFFLINFPDRKAAISARMNDVIQVS